MVVEITAILGSDDSFSWRTLTFDGEEGRGWASDAWGRSGQILGEPPPCNPWLTRVTVARHSSMRDRSEGQRKGWRELVPGGDGA